MRRFYETLLADKAAMLLHRADDRNTLKRLMLKTQNGSVGRPDAAVDRLMEDNMQVRIGDEVHHHHPAPEPTTTTAPQPAATSAPAGAPRSTLTDWLKRAAVAAALLGTGGAIPVAGAYLLNWIRPATEAAPAAVDTDTQYELRLGGPD